MKQVNHFKLQFFANIAQIGSGVIGCCVQSCMNACGYQFWISVTDCSDEEETTSDRSKCQSGRWHHQPQGHRSARCGGIVLPTNWTNIGHIVIRLVLNLLLSTLINCERERHFKFLLQLFVKHENCSVMFIITYKFQKERLPKWGIYLFERM